MKVLIILSTLLLSISTYARTIASVDDVAAEITLNKVTSAPQFGQYLRSGSYHVTAGRNDPFSEEIMFFLVTKSLNILSTQADYLSFHKYFKVEYDRLLAANRNTSFVIGRDELFPVIRNYIVHKREIKLSIEKFNSIIEENEELYVKIKFIFSLKANTTYYVFTPENSHLVIDSSGSLTTVTVSAEGSRTKRWTLTASRLMHFASIDEQLDHDLEKASEIKPTLEYIHKVLPIRTIKDHLTKILNQI
jgi:hypothetical protein